MKSINITFIISLLFLANIIQASQNDFPLIESFLINPSVSQFNYVQFSTLTESITKDPFIFCSISGANALYEAAKNNRKFEINILIQGGADKATNEKGLTAINEATLDRHITLNSLRNLIENKVDVKVKNCSQLTAIEFAIKIRNLIAVALLYPSYADCSEGILPIDFARQQHANLEKELANTKEEKFTKKGNIKIAIDATENIIKIIEAIK